MPISLPAGGMRELLGRLMNEDIECDYDLEPEPWWIFVDPGQGEQILMKVTDHGSGMSDEVKERIFEPFFTTKERNHGTGLGLSTVYGLVKQYKGRISAESELGKGSTFTVLFPGFEKSTQVAKSLPSEPSSLEGTETVLVVEDQEDVRAVICIILRGHGYRVMEARNGSEALTWYAGHAAEIDLVLTDMVMPHLGGAGLAKGIRKINPDVKLIFMSGYPEKERGQDDPIGPETHYLQKPFRSEIL